MHEWTGGLGRKKLLQVETALHQGWGMLSRSWGGWGPGVTLHTWPDVEVTFLSISLSSNGFLLHTTGLMSVYYQCWIQVQSQWWLCLSAFPQQFSQTILFFFFDSINYSDKKMLILRTEFCPSSPLQRSLRSSSRWAEPALGGKLNVPLLIKPPNRWN